jgi:hypothetical protein
MDNTVSTNTLSANAVSVATPKSAASDTATQIHPLDDQQIWLNEPMFAHPAHVDIKRAQADIDAIIGVTRDNQPIMKLVWNGDRNYWLEYFMEWNSIGQPTAPAFKRPLVRYKAFRDINKKLVRDVFPPRWLILARIEREQYFDVWKDDSYFFAPEINGFKQIRPDVPPKDFYLWFATIAKHNDYCCETAEHKGNRCYGQYADPSFFLPYLGEQKRAIEKTGAKNNPFAELDADDFRYIQDENTGYNEEIAQLEIDAQIYMENPYALLGLIPSLKAEVSGKQAEQIVRDYFDKELNETSKLIK